MQSDLKTGKKRKRERVNEIKIKYQSLTDSLTLTE